MNLDRFPLPEEPWSGDPGHCRERDFDASEPWKDPDLPEGRRFGKLRAADARAERMVDSGIMPAAVVDDVAREIGVVDAD